MCTADFARELAVVNYDLSLLEAIGWCSESWTSWAAALPTRSTLRRQQGDSSSTS